MTPWLPDAFGRLITIAPRDNSEDEARSAKTTALDEEEIELEGIIDVKATNLKFERCLINADLKHTPADTEGNWIPLPADWHDLFDAYTIECKACVSILADSKIRHSRRATVKASKFTCTSHHIAPKPLGLSQSNFGTPLLFDRVSSLSLFGNVRSTNSPRS
jgi:hypothetical protein